MLISQRPKRFCIAPLMDNNLGLLSLESDDTKQLFRVFSGTYERQSMVPATNFEAGR